MRSNRTGCSVVTASATKRTKVAISGGLLLSFLTAVAILAFALPVGHGEDTTFKTCFERSLFSPMLLLIASLMNPFLFLPILGVYVALAIWLFLFAFRAVRFWKPKRIFFSFIFMTVLAILHHLIALAITMGFSRLDN